MNKYHGFQVRDLEKLKRRVIVYMGDELADWLESKALEGYKKAALIRRMVWEQMRKELNEVEK